MKFIITIDVEEDNPWNKPREISTLNSRYIPRFQKLCDNYRVKPTYLCSYEMIQCKDFCNFVRPVLEKENAEVGAHLHPWRCPPIREITGQDYKYLPYPNEYSDEDIHAKLDVLTGTIREKLGFHPKSYRAGRWGFVTRHVPILEELGYRVDSSVTPKISWKDTEGLPGGEGGPDFSFANTHPYFYGGDKNINKENAILEVPVTILYPFWLFNKWNVKGKFYTNNQNRWLKRIVSRLGLAPRWLRPYGFMRMKDLVLLYKRAREIELPCINLMFHSNELMPGGSPYNPDELAVELLYGKLESFFEYLSKENVIGETLSGFSRTIKEEG